MSDARYKIRNKEGIHFITFAVVEWMDVFTRKEYRDILLDSIRHCQKEKGLLVHAWCVMSNHVHLIISAKNNDTSGILRDYKNLPGNKSSKLLRKMNRKADETGCWRFSKKLEPQIAETVSTSFGGKTTSQKSYSTRNLQNRS